MYTSVRQNVVWTSPDILFFMEIMSDKVISEYKKSYLVYFENFHFL